jgi:hypothetical protein
VLRRRLRAAEALKRTAPGEAPRPAIVPAPLRLSIEADPVEERWRAARRAGLLAADCVLIALVTWLGVRAVGAGIWASLAAASFGYLVCGRLLGAASPLERVMIHMRPAPAAPADDTPSDEVPVRGAASTVA